MVFIDVGPRNSVWDASNQNNLALHEDASLASPDGNPAHTWITSADLAWKNGQSGYRLGQHFSLQTPSLIGLPTPPAPWASLDVFRTQIRDSEKISEGTQDMRAFALDTVLPYPPSGPATSGGDVQQSYYNGMGQLFWNQRVTFITACFHPDRAYSPLDPADTASRAGCFSKTNLDSSGGKICFGGGTQYWEAHEDWYANGDGAYSIGGVTVNSAGTKTGGPGFTRNSSSAPDQFDKRISF